MKKIIALLLGLLASPAWGQAVQQSGTITSGHAARWTTNGVIQDAGTAANGSLTSLGVTASGPGICQNSAPITSAGYQRICLGATTAGGGLISVQNFGTASPLGLQFSVNGSVQGVPLVSLPVTADNPVCFLDTTGTLKDCSAPGAVNLTVGSTTITSGTTARVLYDNAGVLGEVSPITTINSVACTLGSSCSITAAASLVVGTTPISSGTTLRVLYDNAGALGEYTNTQLTALINPATASLSGALPAWPNNTTTYFRGDGAYVTLNCAALTTPCITGNQSISLTGDVTGSGTTAITTVLANIPTGTPAVGTILHTNIAAPSSPASGKVSVYSDSTDLRFHDKNASGVIGTTVVSSTLASHNFANSISAAGVLGGAQPVIGDLSNINANTMLGNWTSGSAAILANTMPSCGDSGGNHLNYVNGTGVTCGTSGSPTGLTVGSSVISGGTTLRVLYDNAGVLGEYTNTQLTALINAATASLSGALPAWPNNTTTFFRGDGAYVTLNCAALASVGGGCSMLTTAGGDLSGTLPSPTVVAINGVGLGSTTATSGNLLIGSGSQWVAHQPSGDVSLTSAGAFALVTAQPAVHTWALAQTFTVAPVFTDASGSRTALGLGTMATQAASGVAITGGTIAGLTGLAIRDTSAAFDVTLAATSGTTLTAGRTLTLSMGNVAHTLALGTTANTITFPNLASFTVITSGDTGSVTSTILANSLSLVTPNINVATATSIAVGGCTISTDAFCVGTGTSKFTGSLTVSAAPLVTSGNLSAAAWTTAGVRIKSAAASYTDTSSSGTVATAYTDLHGAGTILASSSTTYTNYFGAYFVNPVASTNVTMTNKWSLGADSAKIGTSNQVTISTAGVITATSPVFTTPSLGAATATSINGLIVTTTAGTLTIANNASASLITSGNFALTLTSTATTNSTLPAGTHTLAALDLADQTLSGGANVTAQSQSTGNITIDCGSRPLQFITNNGAWVITAPSSDGSCILLVTNGASAATATYSGFSPATPGGDTINNTNGNKFMLSVARINGTTTGRWLAMQ